MRTKRPILSLGALVIATSLLFAGEKTLPAVPQSPSADGRGRLAAGVVEKGNLFSAVSLAQSSFAESWAAIRPDAVARFPGLKLTAREDLHVTVVYIGGGWRPEDLGLIGAFALVSPTGVLCLSPEAVRLGASRHVVAVELHGPQEVWADAVTGAKLELNRLGLKRPDPYDTNFRPHVTLARAAGSRPTEVETQALEAFQTWLEEKVQIDPGAFTLSFGPETRVRLLLAGATRPAGAPEYIPVEDLLERLSPPQWP